MKFQIIEGRKYFVHRYKWSHDDKRQQFKRAFKEGKVKLLQKTKEGCLYQGIATGSNNV